MLGVLCGRHKPWILTSLSSLLHVSSPAHHRFQTPITTSVSDHLQRRRHSTTCRLSESIGGAASIWHAILPSSRINILPAIHHDILRAEGSWNVAWDARPARWLHRSDSAWLLFGVCPCLLPPPCHVFDCSLVNLEVATNDKISDASDNEDLNVVVSAEENLADDSSTSPNYKVTGVLSDGRCLFRAIAHGACLRNGEAAPDENRQRELADELRAQVVDELLKRREESEWFIEGDFDVYVKRIQLPYVWGGEPELLMASHVLKTPISVFMTDPKSNGLINIANYGIDYQADREAPINVLFHGYGHYDLVESMSNQI